MRAPVDRRCFALAVATLLVAVCDGGANAQARTQLTNGASSELRGDRDPPTRGLVPNEEFRAMRRDHWKRALEHEELLRRARLGQQRPVSKHPKPPPTDMRAHGTVGSVRAVQSQRRPRPDDDSGGRRDGHRPTHAEQIRSTWRLADLPEKKRAPLAWRRVRPPTTVRGSPVQGKLGRRRPDDDDGDGGPRETHTRRRAEGDGRQLFISGKRSTQARRQSASAPAVGNSPLPDFQHSVDFKQSLRAKCPPPSNGGLPSPSQISVTGLPNTGTNALQRLLKARLDVRVANGPTFGLWKHIMPFHPEMERILTANCSRWEREWHAQVFSVRHPLQWLPSQTTPLTSFGSVCRAGAHCTFLACVDGCKKGHANPQRHLPPHKYQFPTLLDLWAAHATHVPGDGVIPNALVVRYEDLLEDREAVVRRVASAFGIPLRTLNATDVDPLSTNTREFIKKDKGKALRHSQQRWREFRDFWRERGVDPLQGGEAAASKPGAGLQCGAALQNGRNVLLSANNYNVLKSILTDRPGVLRQATAMHGYQVPTVRQVFKALESCKAQQSRKPF